ncbi:hypothetical protein ACOME3_003608 [Neoechinorhynchus agilis]
MATIADAAIENIYQKKTQLEHILIRPDTYVGSTEKSTQEMWILDEATERRQPNSDSDDEGDTLVVQRPRMIKRSITYVPALYKIFDEILVNAADNKQRDPKMSTVKVTIEPEKNSIVIFNDGRGIPVTVHKKEKMYVPTLIFGHLLTSSNFDDNQKKVTGGRNGYGAKLCNVFSTEFTVETSCSEFGQFFKQTWKKNMTIPDDPKIEPARKNDFTRITFKPDLAKFNMDFLDDDIVSLFKRRVYDIAAAVPGVHVYLNSKRVPISRFEDYVKLYTNECSDEANNPLQVIYQRFGPRWEVAVTISEGGFQQMSFVNSIATTKGGKHVDYIVDQIVAKIGETVKKKNKSGTDIKPHQLKNYLWVFVNCLIENPTFDSQTKEFMTLANRHFGSKCEVSEDFLKKVKDKCGVVESILRWVEFKQKTLLEKKGGGTKTLKMRGIAKLDDANDAGTRNSSKCTLIVTEGDSAKTLMC